MALLGQIFQTATTSLPTLKISKWDVMVLKEKKPAKKQPDNKIDALRQSVEGAIGFIKEKITDLQDAVSSIFQGSDENYESVAEFDSCISVNGTHDSQIIQNTIEKGSFRAVNKQQKPDIFTVELAKGGYRLGIENVLTALKKLERSLKVCRIVTPFGRINNLNLVKLEYRYTRDEGSNLLIAKLTFQEIKTGTVSASFVNVKNPADSKQQNSGNLATKEKREWR